MYDDSNICPMPRELAVRTIDSIEVALIWDPVGGELTVTVIDTAAAHAFSVPVAEADPLDVYRHPYWYAACRGIEMPATG